MSATSYILRSQGVDLVYTFIFPFHYILFACLRKETHQHCYIYTYNIPNVTNAADLPETA